MAAHPPAERARLARRAARSLLALFLGLLACELALRAASLVARGTLEDRGAWEEPGPGGLSIACAGDSNTYGVLELAGDAYPARLQQLLDARVPGGPHRVHNLGIPGLNTRQAAALVEQALGEHRVDAVLFLAGANNSWSWVGSAAVEWLRPPWYERLRLVALARIARAHLGPARSGGERGRAPPDEIEVDDRGLERGLTESGVDRLGRRFAFRATSRETAIPLDEMEASIRADLARVAELCRGRGVPLVVLTYGSELGLYADANRALRAAAVELRLPLADCAARLAEARAELGFDCLWHADGHPNLLGYELVAREVYATLVSAGIAAGAPIEEPLRGLATLGDDPEQLRAYGSFEEARAGDGDFGVEVRGAAPATRFALVLWAPGELEARPPMLGAIGPDGTGRLSLAELARGAASPSGEVVRVRAMSALLAGEPDARVLRFTRPTELVLQ